MDGKCSESLYSTVTFDNNKKCTQPLKCVWNINTYLYLTVHVRNNNFNCYLYNCVYNLIGKHTNKSLTKQQA